MTNFIEKVFPLDISYGSSGGPEYNTHITTSICGNEVRNINWHKPRMKFYVSHGVKNHAQMTALINFFRCCKGRALGFRYKDWSDYKATNQLLGYGDNIEKTFQLIKYYSIDDIIEKRIIYKPIHGSVTIYINKTPCYDCHIAYDTGLITFPIPPKKLDIITADFEFHVPVRFDIDQISTTIESSDFFSFDDIKLIEIKL